MNDYIEDIVGDEEQNPRKLLEQFYYLYSEKYDMVLSKDRLYGCSEGYPVDLTDYYRFWRRYQQ